MSTRVWFLAVLSAALVFAQSDEDSLKVPTVEVKGKCVLPSAFSAGFSFKPVEDVVFFDAQSYEIDSSSVYPIIKEYGEFLSRNIDAVLHIRGYYSPDYDDILSPIKGMQLATNRAKSIFKMISLSFPAVTNRIVIDSGYVYEKSFGDTVSPQDARVELDVEWSGYSLRKFYPRDKVPYWRASYKGIIKDIAPVLEKILSRNPDARALMVGYGFPANADGYRWLAYLRDKVIQKVGERYASRFGLYVVDDEFAGKTTYAQIELIPFFRSPGKDSVAWLEPSPGCSVEVKIGGVSVIPNKVFAQISGDFPSAPVAINTGGDSSFSVKLAVVPLLPGNYRVNLCLGELGVPRDVPEYSVSLSDSFSVVLNFEIPKPLRREEAEIFGADMWYVAQLVAHLGKFDGAGKITLSVKAREDSVASADGKKYWDVFADQLCSITGVKRKKLAGWFEKRNVEVEVVPEAVPNLSPDESRRFSVVIQFAGAR